MSLPVFTLFQAIEPALVSQGFSPTRVLLADRTGPSSDAGGSAERPGVSHRKVSLRPDGTVDPVDADTRNGLDGGQVLVWCGPDDPAAVSETVEALGADAVAVATSEDGWRTTAALFDLGFVRVGTADAAGRSVTGYLRSARVRYPLRLTGPTRGVAAMSNLGSNGRFANQLFQYAFLRLYALRHELAVATPRWEGCDLFGITDPEPGPAKLAHLRFFAFDDDDLALWTGEAQPIDVDFDGYFQELPDCWIHHRALLARLFRPTYPLASGVDDWMARLTDGGRRPLAAIHVRRGDYPDLFAGGLDWYRPIPLDWYRAWLDRLKASGIDAVVYVATDAPDEVLEAFRSFDPVTAADRPDTDTPAHIVDFEVMRRASHLAIANSSFSRMAALLAHGDQDVAIPDVRGEKFQPWDAWAERRFWDRFAPQGAASRGAGSSTAAIRQRGVALRTTLAVMADTAEWSKEQLAHKDRVIGEKDEAIGGLQSEVAAFKLWIDEKDAYIDELRRQVASGEERVRRADAGGVEQLRALAATRAALTATLAARDGEVARLSATHAERLKEVERRSSDEQHKLREAHNADIAQRSAAYAERLGEVEGQFEEMRVQLERAEEERDRLSEAFHAVSADRAMVDAARERATQAHNAAIFLGSPRGLARRFAFRPVIHVLSVSSRISDAVGLLGLSGKLRHDADMLRGRRYREWGGLLRRRLMRTARPGQLRDGGARGLTIIEPPAALAAEASSLPETSAVSRTERQAELRCIAEAVPAFADAGLPNVVVVVPWLMQGGSEVVLLDVLRSISASINISLITTLGARHTNAGLFAPLVREIHHLDGDLDHEEATGFLVAVCRTRRARVLFSSNADLVYRNAPLLKAAHPGLTIIDLLHNDLRIGHFASAVAAARSIDRQVVVGSHIAAALEEHGVDAARIITIPNGIDTASTFNPKLKTPRDGRRFHGLRKGGFVLGFVGRMSPEKRPSAFLEIVEALDGLPDLRVVMVGSGPLDAEIEARSSRLGRPVVWHRHLDRSHMALAYAAMDVLVVPSTIEGMPLAVLEAMAMGVPVAATDVGNIGQIVDHDRNGFIVDIDSYLEIASFVRDLVLEPRRRAAMGRAAREAIIARGLTRSAMLDGYRNLFQTATGAGI